MSGMKKLLSGAWDRDKRGKNTYKIKRKKLTAEPDNPRMEQYRGWGGRILPRVKKNPN